MIPQFPFFLCKFLAIRNWLCPTMHPLAGFDPLPRPKGKEANCFCNSKCMSPKPTLVLPTLIFSGICYNDILQLPRGAGSPSVSGTDTGLAQSSVEMLVALQAGRGYCTPTTKQFLQFPLSQHTRELTG